MSIPWRAYQQDVAKLFQSLGCSVEIEKEVAGARGNHVVDVLAQTTFAGGVAPVNQDTQTPLS